ncbi:MAG: hypothetical protein P1V13_15100 [Rhizobiaceae bacterium]|nr:hypothetical protein [Rhizobiaceae bacterium]
MLNTLFDWLDGLGSGSASFVGTFFSFIFAVLALIVGALFNYCLNRRRDERLRAQEANTVAAALYGEMLLLRQELARAGNVAARIGMGNSMTTSFDQLYVDENPISEPKLFDALSGKLGLLPAQDVISITSFHKNVRAIRWWMPRMQEDEIRDYSYSILYILHPVRDAVQGIVPTLRAIEARLQIEIQADDPDIGLVLQLIEYEEHNLDLHNK